MRTATIAITSALMILGGCTLEADPPTELTQPLPAQGGCGDTFTTNSGAAQFGGANPAGSNAGGAHQGGANQGGMKSQGGSPPSCDQLLADCYQSHAACLQVSTPDVCDTQLRTCADIQTTCDSVFTECDEYLLESEPGQEEDAYKEADAYCRLSEAVLTESQFTPDGLQFTCCNLPTSR